MRLGTGWDDVSDQQKESAVYIKPNELIKETSEGNFSQNTLREVAVEVPATSGRYHLTKITDISQLRRIAKASTGLGGKLHEVGISMDASASKAHCLDTRQTYYLLEIVSVERTIKLSGIPVLSDVARQVLKPTTKASATTCDHEPHHITTCDIGNFYRIFGSHYVSENSFGRRIVALITMDSSKMTDSSTFSIAGQVTAPMANAHAAVSHQVSRLKQSAVMNIKISTDGFDTTAFVPPNTIEELQNLLKAFSDKKTHTAEPALIGYRLSPYRGVLSAEAAPLQDVERFTQSIEQHCELIDKLIALRAKAVARYGHRYFHDPNFHIAGDAAMQARIQSHPHTQRVAYLLESLKRIIKLIDSQITALKNTIFYNDSHEQVKQHWLTLLHHFKQIDAELDKRGKYRLVGEYTIDLANKKPNESFFLQISLLLPAETAFLVLSAAPGTIQRLKDTPHTISYDDTLESEIATNTEGVDDADNSYSHQSTSGDFRVRKKSPWYQLCTPPNLLDKHNRFEAVSPSRINGAKSLGIEVVTPKDSTNSTWTVHLFAQRRPANTTTEDAAPQLAIMPQH